MLAGAQKELRLKLLIGPQPKKDGTNFAADYQSMVIGTIT